MEPINYSFPTNLSLHEPGPYYNTFLFDKLYSHLDHIHISWAPPKQSLQLKSLKDIWFWVYDIAQENMIFQISLLPSSPWDYASRKKKDILCKTAEWTAWVPHLLWLHWNLIKYCPTPPYNWLCMCCNYLTTNKELVYKWRITISSQQLNWPIPPYIVYILEKIKNTF